MSDEVIPLDKLAKIYRKIYSRTNELTTEYESKLEELKLQQEEIKNAMKDQMVALGQKLMVRGTPGLFFADGSRVGGAIPKEEIEKRLQQAM